MYLFFNDKKCIEVHLFPLKDIVKESKDKPHIVTNFYLPLPLQGLVLGPAQ